MEDRERLMGLSCKVYIHIDRYIGETRETGLGIWWGEGWWSHGGWLVDQRQCNVGPCRN